MLMPQHIDQRPKVNGETVIVVMWHNVDITTSRGVALQQG
jgi:hypothetical protein